MGDITLYGNEVLPEVREYMYAEAEMTVSYNLIQDYFFNLMDSFRDETIYYGEADDDGEVKTGFFAKIGQMFVKMWKAIINFIKTVFRKTWEILSKPFSFKMNRANNASGGGGGGGGSSTPTERTAGGGGAEETANKITTTDFRQYQEIANLRRNLVSYLGKMSTVEKDKLLATFAIMKDDSVKNISLTKIDKKGIYADHIANMAAIKKNLLENFKLIYDYDELKDTDAIKNVADAPAMNVFYKDVPKHSLINVKYEKPKEDENVVKKGIASLFGIQMIAKKIIECTSKVTDKTKTVYNKTAEDSIAKDIRSLINTILGIDMSDTGTHTGLITDKENDITVFGDYNILELSKAVNVIYVYAFGENALKLLKNDPIGEIQSKLGSNTVIKPEAYETNKGIFLKKMVNVNIADKILETVQIKADGNQPESLTSILTKNFRNAGGKKPATSYDTLRDQLLKALETFKDLREGNEKKDSEGKTEYDKITNENKAVKASELWKGIVTNAAKIIKNVASSAPEMARTITRIDTAIVIHKHLYNTILSVSVTANLWDVYCHMYKVAKDNLENNKELIKDITGDDNATKEHKAIKEKLSALDTEVADLKVQLQKELKGKQ